LRDVRPGDMGDVLYGRPLPNLEQGALYNSGLNLIAIPARSKNAIDFRKDCRIVDCSRDLIAFAVGNLAHRAAQDFSRARFR